MTTISNQMTANHYLFRSRILTHVTFWVFYYILFSFLWSKEGNYYESFGLEFILMPIRISMAYLTMYYLIPQFLLKDRLIQFAWRYGLFLLLAGVLQRVFIYFFHEVFFIDSGRSVIDVQGVVRAMVLVNSTVLFLSALKMYSYWKEERLKRTDTLEKTIEIRSEKRIYRIKPSDIQYIEGLGNYVTFYISNRKPLISYMSLKEATKNLPDNFHRIHKSFIINKNRIDSYTNENVEIEGRIIPVGKSITLEI
ncbi:MAG: LytTR family DNA-binding domain-containing protein [Bacteroidota bacterium]